MMSNPSLPPIPEPHWPMQELTELTRAAVTLLGASRVWLALADRKGSIAPRTAASVVERGAPAQSDPQSLQKFTEALIAVLYQRGSPEPLILPDTQRAPELLRTIGPRETPPSALAAVALAHHGRMIGALIATSDHTGGFSDAVRQPLTMLAGMAVTAIRLTTDLDRNASQATELSALLNATRALTSTLEPPQVFQAIIASVQSVISCDRALIYHYEERGKQLRVVASIGEGPEALQGTTIALTDPHSKAAWVARERHNYIGVVRPEDETGTHTDALRPGATFSLLCVPLITKKHLRGVASLARRDGFTKQEVTMMERLGAIAAAALENADLFNQSQAARQQQEALFREASDGFAMVDEAYRFTQVNPAFADYLSARPDSLLGQICCQAFSLPTGGAPASPASCRLCQDEPQCLIRQVMDSRATRDHIERLFPSQNQTPVSEPTLGARAAHPSSGPQVLSRVIDFSLTATTGADQGPRVLLVGRDVTGAREVQRFRAEQIQLISHEMAAPLMTISANIEFFLRYSDQHVAPEHLAVLDTARATAMSMRTLVDDLDLISRRDAGELRIDRKSTDIAQEAHEAVSEMTILAQQKGIALHAQLEPYAPPAMADPARVRQVARNLISNAIKFTPQGKHIRVAVTSDREWVTLQVEDTGMGIPESDLQKIWDRSYRSPYTANTGAPGRGLGLAIVRIIMTAHGGTYDAKSVLGSGTVFTVSFPRADRGGRG